MASEIKLPELERKILSCLWKLNNRGTVHEVIDLWAEDEKPGYTTILKKLQIMEEKGIVTHEKEGKAYRYIPLVTKDEVSRSGVSSLLNSLFGGDKLELAQTFINTSDLSSGEIDAIKKMLEQKKKEDER